MRKLIAAGFAVALVSGAAGATVRDFSGPYHAKVRCHGITEEAAANVVLLDFHRRSDGSVHLLYRCKRQGP